MNNNQDPMPSQEQENKSLLDLVRKLLLAGVGAVVWAQESVTELVENRDANVSGFLEDVQAFVDKLVERGEIAERDGRQLVNELLEKRRTTQGDLLESARSRAKSAETTVSDQVEGILAHLPTLDDIEKLTSKLMNLGRKVDELKQQVGDSVEEVIVTASDNLAEAAAATGAEAKKAARKTRAKAAEVVDAVESETKKVARAGRKKAADVAAAAEAEVKKTVRKTRSNAAKAGDAVAGVVEQVTDTAHETAEAIAVEVSHVSETFEEAIPA